MREKLYFMGSNWGEIPLSKIKYALKQLGFSDTVIYHASHFTTFTNKTVYVLDEAGNLDNLGSITAFTNPLVRFKEMYGIEIDELKSIGDLIKELNSHDPFYFI